MRIFGTQSYGGVVQAQAVQAKQSSASGWKDMPHINQMWPRGGGQGYVNGAYNCGACAVAMLARGWGNKSGLNDAQLITHLARGNVTEKGSTPNDVAAMLERAGVPRLKPALGGPFDSGRVKEHLNKGRMLIAQVGVTDKKTKEVSTHYVVIKKMTKDGNYVISDPLKKKDTVVSPQQLARAVNKASPSGGGGTMIPVGRPGGDLKPETPPPTAPASPFDPWAFQYPVGPRDLMRQQLFQPYPQDPMGVRLRPGRMDIQQGYDAQQGSYLQPNGSRPGYSMQDQFMAASPYRLNPMTGLSQPFAPMPAEPTPAKPVPKSKTDKNAFMASDSEFVGVSKDFVPLSGGKGGSKPRVDISYRRHGDKGERPRKSLTPRNLSVEQYARRLLNAKDAGKDIGERLARLELSPFKKDKAVLAYIEKVDRELGGIGKRFTPESFG